MKIIDKNRDYYDYLQNVELDDTFTFDRRGSHELTTEDIIRPFQKWTVCSFFQKDYLNTGYYLIQAGSTFWLIFVQFKDFNDNGIPQNCEILSSETWKDYDKPRKVLSVTGIQVDMFSYFRRKHKESMSEYLSDVKARVKSNDYKELCSFTKGALIKDNASYVCPYPILKNTFIPSVIPAADLYHAIEEHFSMEKTAQERIESEGITDTEKVINHGFDKKSSFRNVK